MFCTILVPLDGSTFAEHAIPLAVTLGKCCGATVRLLQVVPPLADYFFMPPLKTDPLDTQLRDLHRTYAQTYLDGVVSRLKNAGRILCDVMEEQEGVCESICANVVTTGADLIVMTSHGRGAVARFWLGSNADELVRTAPVPVLLARPPEHSPPADLQHPVSVKHILIALAGDTPAEHIVMPALSIGKVTGARYTLVNVVQPAFPHLLPALPADASDKSASGRSGLDDIDAQNCQKAEQYLSGVADRLRAEGAVVETRVPVAEQPAAAILREATIGGAEMIALETHGRGISRLLIGSVADKVVRGSSIPVLVCRLTREKS